MLAADRSAPVTAAEAAALFADLADSVHLVLAVSGGPDSVALMWLAARWRAGLTTGPDLVAVTVDHGLRPEAKREADAVRRLAETLAISHRTVRWRGTKPDTGIQEAARDARYRLLAAAARKAGATRVLTGHTLDDQAETVLFRLSRGSGLAGLAAMAPVSPLPACDGEDISLVRPFLTVPKARPIATLQDAAIDYADDPSNDDPRFARPRLRRLMPALAGEGLDAGRLAGFALRVRRAEEALAAVTGGIVARMPPWPPGGPIVLWRQEFSGWPAEIAIRVLRRAIDATGNEGPAELGKLEALAEELRASASERHRTIRRTLAGAVVTLSAETLTIGRAPARRKAALAGRKR